MIWPFSRKETSRLDPEVAAVFEKLYLFLRDERAQLERYPEALRTRALGGIDADENPKAFGPFGTTITNPIPVNGPVGEVLYLSSLRRGNQRILFHRLTSINEMDAYECVSLDGTFWDILFLDMYHPRKSRKAPHGYTIERTNTLISGMNSYVSDFPYGAYEATISYSEKSFGMSIADPSVRLGIKATKFARPERHAARINEILVAQGTQDQGEIVHLLAKEVISAQAALFDRLVKTKELGLARDQVRGLEIAFFVLALMTYTLFRWARATDAAVLADKVALHVIRLNVEASAHPVQLQRAVKAYQQRQTQYKDALLYHPFNEKDLKQHQLSFGLKLTQNIIGRDDALLGALLSSTGYIILSEFKEVVEESGLSRTA